ncbi:MAG TPA: cytochrome c [Stellaceae bacterium]|nr:cytochrome c [Stellaceae bacterium]
MRRKFEVLLAVAIAAVTAGCAGQDHRGSQSRGRAVAEQWCAECHRIAPDQPSGMRPGHILPPPVAAPSFMTVAHRPYADRAYLKSFISELHPPMPTSRLSPGEREDVVAYLLSLRNTP